MEVTNNDFEAAHRSLHELLGQRCSTSDYDIESHSHDESFHPPAPPDVVAFPESNDEVAAVVQICRDHLIPVIPFGAGTAVEGHVQATRGGVSLDLLRMNKVLDLQTDDLDCRVQAGIRRLALNDQLEKHGMWLPVDPGADAAIGGMAATGASGTTTVRYGTIRENVLGLTCVLADGRIIQTGGRARKSSAGYDLTKLMLGSEGTLGVITEVQLKLQPLPESVAAAVCSFSDIAGCVDAVIEILQSGIPVARCELLDTASMQAVNKPFKAGLRACSDNVLRVPRHSGQRRGTGQAIRRDRRRARRRGLPVGAGTRKQRETVARPPPRLLRHQSPASRLIWLGERRLRPNLATCRLHFRNIARD